MKTSHILHTSIILIGLCLILQKTKIKNGLAKVACNLLVVKVFWRDIKMILWQLMVLKE